MKSTKTNFVAIVRKALRDSGFDPSYTDPCAGGYRMKVYSTFNAIFTAFNDQYPSSTDLTDEALTARTTTWQDFLYGPVSCKIKLDHINKMETWVEQQQFPFTVMVDIRGAGYISLIIPISE